MQAHSQGGSVGSEEPHLQRKVLYLVMKGPLFKNKLHILKYKVHCYNYTIQGNRNWPGRLGSCQAKVSPTIKLKIVAINYYYYYY